MMDFTDTHEGLNDGTYFMVTKTLSTGTLLFCSDNEGWQHIKQRATLYTGEELGELFDETDMDPKGTEPVVVYPVTRLGSLSKQGIKNDAAYKA